MDFASFVGIISGVTLVFISLKMGGNIASFYDLPSILIVLGGTITTTLFTFRFLEVLTAFKAAFFVFREKRQDPNDTVAMMVRLNDISRKNGLLALGEVRTNAIFLKKMCSLLADGADKSLLQNTMKIEIQALEARHVQVQDVFKRMGTYAPAFGMLGTLIGLIQMLTKLDDPSKVGPAMALALVTTFYGSILSTMFFLPVAAKLRSRTLTELNTLHIIFEGISSIHSGDDTYLIYEKLSSFIPLRERKPMKRSVSSKAEES